MTVVIRTGGADDAVALAELAARTFEETFAAENDAGDLALYLAQAYGPAQQREELADPRIVTLLAVAGERLAGFAQLRFGTAPACVIGAAPAELWRLYVAADWHGRGVAQALMQRVVREAQDRGGRTLWLGVWERNARAKAFYAKSGFTDVGSHVFTLGNDAQTDRILVRPLR